MTDWVVDASVAVKWVLPESDTDRAVTLLSADHQLLAPDLMQVEVANVLWKRYRRGELTAEDGTVLLTAMARVPVRRFADAPLLEAAFAIASTFGRSVYDSVYVALALREHARLVTADRRLYNALKATSLADHLHWLGDLPP